MSAFTQRRNTHSPKKKNSTHSYYTGSKSAVGEAFRTLRTNIQFSGVDSKNQMILITSAGPNEGKTLVSCNIASAFSVAGKKTLLMDCDLRNPSIKDYFPTTTGGVTDVLVKGGDYVNYLAYPDGHEHLDVLQAGSTSPNPSELLSSEKMRTLLQTMREHYDVIIIDTAPVGLVTDAAILSTLVDGTILIAKEGMTDRKQLRSAKENLDAVGAHLLGVVLNQVKKPTTGYYGGYYG